MSKVKIVTTKENRIGNILNSGYGKIVVGTDGVAEVDQEVADHFVNNGSGWDYVNKPKSAVKGDVNGDGKVDGKDLSEVHKEYAKAAKEAEEDNETATGSVDVEEIDEPANGGQTETIEDDAVSIEDQINSINKLAELKALAKDSGLPEDQWSKLKSKKEMKEYLIGKLSD